MSPVGMWEWLLHSKLKTDLFLQWFAPHIHPQITRSDWFELSHTYSFRCSSSLIFLVADKVQQINQTLVGFWACDIHSFIHSFILRSFVHTWGTSCSRIWWWTVNWSTRCPSFNLTRCWLSSVAEASRGNSAASIISLHTWTTFTV